MKTLSLVALAVLVGVVVALSGCGGTDTAGSSPFAGDWTGTFSIPADSEVGTLTLHVSAAGVVSGTFTNTTAEVSGALAGTISDDGDFIGNLNAPGVFSSALTGSFSQPVDEQMTGTLIQAADSATLLVSLTRS